MNTAQRSPNMSIDEDFYKMNFDFLDYRPSVDNVEMLKFLVSHGIRILLFFVELNFHKKEV